MNIWAKDCVLITFRNWTANKQNLVDKQYTSYGKPFISSTTTTFEFQVQLYKQTLKSL